jgi:hypothetical protein
VVVGGKTELVLTAAHRALAQGRFPGRVLFADVVRLHGSALLGGFLRAMGLNSPATAARCSSSSTT